MSLSRDWHFWSSPVARSLDHWDDYDSEFRYVGRPVPSLQGLDITAA